MRTVSAALDAAILSGKVCRILKTILPDTTVITLTDHDRPLTIDGDTYQPAPARGGRLFSRQDAAVDSQRIEYGWGSTLESELLGGDYDDARIEYGIAGWDMVIPERLITFKGLVGRLHWNRDVIRSEYVDVMAQLARNIGRTHGPGCPVWLGSQGTGMCNVDLSLFEVAVTVTAVDSGSPRVIFSDSGLGDANGWFDDGDITWSSGPSAGKTNTIEIYASNQFTLQLPARHAIVLGNTGIATPGCDRSHGDGGCNKFSNRVNFQGWPFKREQQELAQ